MSRNGCGTGGFSEQRNPIGITTEIGNFFTYPFYRFDLKIKSNIREKIYLIQKSKVWCEIIRKRCEKT